MAENEKYDIEETKDVMELAIHSYDIFLEFYKKNNVPFAKIIQSIGIIQKAMKNIQMVPREIGDLSSEEARELTGMLGSVVNDPAIQKIFYGLSVVMSGILEKVTKDNPDG